MNTAQLNSLLKKHIDRTKCSFLGVYARDTIPSESSLTHFPCAFISNTDSSRGIGKHWVAFYFISPDHLEFFDSLGRNYLDYGFDKFCSMYPNLESVSFNNRQLQSNTSILCGYYCLYFIIYRSCDHAIDHIINSFSFLDFNWNDSQVYKFYKRFFCHN